MTTTISLSPKEVEELIRKQLRADGFEVEGSITFNVTAGYSDPREYQAAGLTSVTAKVHTKPVPSYSSHSSLASQIDAVESGRVIPR